MTVKDYYKILGVTEFDSAESIKNAYRKLARKWHPDIAGNTQDVIMKFKEINEAYDILSHAVKKQEYDKARKFYNYSKDGYNCYNKTTNAEQKKTTNPNPKNNPFRFNWEDILNKKKYNTKECNNSNKRRGEDVFSEIEISLIEALNGTSKTINMLETIVCPKCEGRKSINGIKCLHCNGEGEFTNYKKFTVKIPAGIKDNSKIRLAGEGSKGYNGGQNGDLYLTVHIKDFKKTVNNDNNIYKKIELSPLQAILGCEYELNTTQGLILVNVAPYTQNGQKIRISGYGNVQNKKIGDMILTVEIKIPQNLSKEELDLYKKLSEISLNKPRENFHD